MHSSISTITKKKIPLEISPTLQNQIYFLCNHIHKDEWSGVLFYEQTTPDLDNDDCKITAQYLVLLDIGSAAYTSYTLGPPIVKILMKNPHLKKMKMGHIHSHNVMSVFFSGTDTSELVDNSEYHNTYLSLIVNNQNDMCAKVAFRTTTTKIATERYVTKYRNSSGEEKEYVTTKDIETDEIRVYAYDCDITKPVIIDQTMVEAFNRIVEEKLEAVRKQKEEEDAKKARTPAAGFERFDAAGRTNYQPMIQANMLDLIDSYEDRGKGKKGSVTVYEGDDDDVVGKRKEKKAKKKERRAGSLNIGIYNFITKVIARSSKYKGKLTDALKKLDEELLTFAEVESFQEYVKKNIDPIYIDCFPEDQNMAKYNKVIEESGEFLIDTVGDEFPQVVDIIISAINLEER